MSDDMAAREQFSKRGSCVLVSIALRCSLISIYPIRNKYDTTTLQNQKLNSVLIPIFRFGRTA